MLDTKACEKGAHFIAVCDAFGLPLIYLVDVPGSAIGSVAERTGLGRRNGRMLYELGCSTVPRVTVVLRKGYGGGYIVMNGGTSFESDASLIWPTAEICAMSIEGSVDIAFRRDYESAADPAARRSELIARIRSQTGPLRAAEHFHIDDVIDPRDTRSWLIDILGVAQPRRRFSPHPRYRSISPV
jgi:propionyl-CoA carboxylase beta chain